MKKFLYISLIASLPLLYSCEKYLDKVAESDDPTADEIYSEFYKFQGLAYSMYNQVVSPIFFWGWSGSFSWYDAYCDEAYSNASWAAAFKMNSGNYWAALYDVQGLFSAHEDATDRVKLWLPSWKGIRTANLVIENAHRVLDATPEEIGETIADAYYFRAYFHFLLGSIWGGLPYTDKVFLPSDDMIVPRLSYHEMTQRLIQDLDTAALLLPETWPSNLEGRITKGAALALKSRALIYDASPLITKAEGISEGEIAERWAAAAEASYDVIMMGSEVDGASQTYALLPLDQYREVCITRGGGLFNSENILLRVGLGSAPVELLYGPSPRYGHGPTNSVTQNMVDMFEMNTGLPFDAAGSGYDPNNPYENRDPRFYNAVLTNGTQWGLEDNEPKFLELYATPNEGREKAGGITGYLLKKLWPDPALGGDRGVPIFRLAEFYLNYAEAVNEAYGPNGSIPGANLTAIDAINILRERVEMPPVDDRYTGDKDSFRKRIINERAVELCFENHRWFDLRRWRLSHKPEFLNIYRMDIEVDPDNDNEPLFYNRSLLQTRIFEEKHYWMPLPREYVFLSDEIKQNPGW